MKFYSSYMDHAFNAESLWCTVHSVMNWVRYHRPIHKFDAIAFRGMSGAAIAFPVSYEIKIPLICVRKDSSHASDIVGGSYEEIISYLILDDFISSGQTVTEIDHKATTAGYKKLECVGVLLYKSPGMKSVEVNIGGTKITYPVWQP